MAEARRILFLFGLRGGKSLLATDLGFWFGLLSSYYLGLHKIISTVDNMHNT